jgi:hypothetical protein
VALIACEECRREISDRAAACPHCGNPMTRKAIAIDEKSVVTTQSTGKGPKAVQIVAALIMSASVAMCINDKGTPSFEGMALFMIGMLVWLTARINAWWKHG